MHKSATKCNETICKWCKNKHGASKIVDTLETYQSNPQNITFRRTLFDPKLVNWEALLKRVAKIQLTTVKDIFRWNLHEKGKFSVASMYNALILPDMSVYDNKKFWKMKIPLKTKSLHGIYVKGLFLLKTILLIAIGIIVKHVFFCSQDGTIKHLFFQCNFARSI
jgi:hypothetical protein